MSVNKRYISVIYLLKSEGNEDTHYSCRACVCGFVSCTCHCNAQRGVV